MPKPSSRILIPLLLLVAGCARHSMSSSRTAAQPPVARVMSYEEYRQARHVVPYVLEVHRGPGELLYFGSQHSFDPNNPQHEEIQRLWQQLKPTLAFNEGGSPPHYATASKTVAMVGESGLVRFLAARDCIPARSLEPPRDSIVKSMITSGVPPEQVKLYEVLLAWISYRQSDQTEPPDAFANRVLRILSQVSGLEGPPHTSAQLAHFYEELFPEAGNWSNISASAFDPLRHESIFDEMARIAGRIRDRHMVHILTTAVRRGERVFAVVGCSHVVMQEPAFRSLFGDTHICTVSPTSQLVVD